MKRNFNKRWLWTLLAIVLLGSVACQQERETFKTLQELMHESVEPDGPGVVLYVNGPGFGEQLFTRGAANRERGTAVRTISHYRLAGLTKPFMSTLVLQMVTEGKLRMDDTIAQHLPELAADIPNSDQVTIRHLLTMTSGLPDFRDNPEFWEVVRQQEKRGWRPEEVLPYIADTAVTGEPGAEFNYSNTNYIILQLILLNLFEEPFEEELQDRILDVLDLQDTYIEPFGLTTGGHIGGYADIDGDGVAESLIPYDDARSMGDLGLISNALNLAEFAPALYERALPGEAKTDALVPMGNGDEYGYGIMRRQSTFGEMWGYASTASGFSHQMWYLPDKETTVIVLINAEEEALGEQLLQDALTAVFEEKP